MNEDVDDELPRTGKRACAKAGHNLPVKVRR